MKHSYQDYLAKRCTHREYYAQFVSPSFKSIVSDQLLKDLLKHKDPNRIPLRVWDRLAVYVMQTGMSLSEGVCIAKEAANQIIEENKEKSICSH